VNLIAQRCWRSLQDGGAEYASLWRSDRTYLLEGMAIRFAEGLWRLDYSVRLDDEWLTRDAVVRWSHGDTSGKLDLARDAAGRWSRDNASDHSLSGCTDVDFGFSPVTNLMPVRRLGGDTGACVAVHAAWLVFPDLGIRPARQTYTRRSASTVLYQSASGFSAEISVDEFGFAVDYPGLWSGG
jgi:hypothetical protein